MSGDLLLLRFVPAAIALYLCVYGPGQALCRVRASALPASFARVTLSLLVTSVVAIILIALDAFSLPRVVAINGALTVFGWVGLGRLRPPLQHSADVAGRFSALVFAVALVWYWPPFEAHFAASDASAYLAAGVQLARYHTLEKTDDLGPLVPPLARPYLFFSTLGMAWKPPYSRMHGGIIVDAPGAEVAHPSFFPLPSAWAAICSDVLGSRYGGGHAPLFAAAAVWAMWLLARARLGFAGALTVTVLTAANAACYWAGRMPLAEPLAWFFLCAALVALDAYEAEGFPADARLAGALLGAAATARVEFAAFVLIALLARHALAPVVPGRRLTPGFALSLAAMLGVAAIQVAFIHGAYVVPLVDAAAGLEWIAQVSWRETAWLVVSGALASVLVYAWLGKRLGLTRASAVVTVVAFAAVYWRMSADHVPLRSLAWLGAYVGWPALALGGLGLLQCWRARVGNPANGFLVLLFAVFGACLILDPHVYPAMPWASRRFVPLVIPALLLLSGVACTALWQRSLTVGLVAWLALLVGVLAPAHQIWGRGYYSGTYDQLQEIVATLPPDGSLLLDNRLAPMLLGPPLWLAYGRNSLPAVLTTIAGRNTVAGMARILKDAGKGPVYLVKPTLTGAAEPIPFSTVTLVTNFTIQVSLPEQTDGPPPKRLEKYTQSVSVYRID